MDVAGTWGVFEWTKIELISRAATHVKCDFLLEAEEIIVEGSGVVLVNTDEAGTLLVTNFRLLFWSEGTRNIIPLGKIPLATIEKFGKIAKEAAERKAKEVSAAIDSLTADLHRERQLNNSAVNLAKKATRENATIKRTVQSFGFKVHFSSSGDCTVDIENSPSSSPQKSMFSSSRRESNGSYGRDEKSGLLVSITVVTDDISSNGSPADLCEDLCPMHKQDCVCRRPDAGCAQFGSQIRANNFDAFDQLSIYVSYFESEEF